MRTINTSVFDGYLNDAASALHHITPYEIEECRAIILAVASYNSIEEIALLLKYAGAPCHEPFKGISAEGAAWAMDVQI